MAAKEISGDGLASNLAGMSKNQLYEIMSQMKTLIEQNHQQARQILIDNPLLTRALFQAQIMLGMVQPPQVTPDIQPQTSQQSPLPTHTVQQTNIPVAQSSPAQVGLHEQANSSQPQIPVRKQLQTQASAPTLSSPVLGLQSQSMSSQSLQQPRADLSSQATPMLLPQSSQILNMPPPSMQQLPVHQTTIPPGHLQRPMRTTGMSHLPLQPTLLPQHRPPITSPLQFQSQMGPNLCFPGIHQPHASQPAFHPNIKPGALGQSFPHGQLPLPNRLPPIPLYQVGGPHLGQDFSSQGGNSLQMERGSNWLPGLPEIPSESQLPSPPQLGHGPMGLGNQPPRPTALTREMEQQLLQQVMSLTPEQINLLPPEQRHQVLQLQQMLRQ
ncbi:hypothetical protein Ancab_016183 [Ancistrocladus abbreviatus]